LRREWVVLLSGTLLLAGCATPFDPGLEAAQSETLRSEQMIAITPRAKQRLQEQERKARGEAPRSKRDGFVSRSDFTQARVHQSLGMSYLSDGQVAMAIRELRSAEDLNPYDSGIQLALAEAYRRRGRLEDAEKHLQTALHNDPDFQAARLTLSGLYIQMARYEDAIQQAAVLADDPTFPRPWTALSNQGFAEIRLGRYDEARHSLENALDYEPRYWRAHLNLGILEEKLGNRQEALRQLESVLALDPGPMGEAEANFRSAEIYISLGKRERAVAHLMAASAAVPESQWGKRSEETLKRLR